MSRFGRLIIGIVVLSVVSLTAEAAITVGSGSSSATVLIEFKDTATYEFEVLFDGPQTGLSLFDIIEQATTLETVRENYGFGWFIDGISYDGHSDVGYVPDDDWWHYYNYDFVEDGWIAPDVGAVDRVISDGDRDGWVYGRSWPTVPEPATLGMLGMGALALIRRRR